MIAIEQRGGEWAVLDDHELVSLHPTRIEAERAALWLAKQESAPDDAA